MATLPAEGRWSVRTLPEDGIEPALEFLRRDPLVNVYLIARLIEERTLAASQMVEVRFNRDIVLIASLATNIVLGTAPATPRWATAGCRSSTSRAAPAGAGRSRRR